MQICYTVILNKKLYKLSFCNKFSCISVRILGLANFTQWFPDYKHVRQVARPITFRE